MFMCMTYKSLLFLPLCLVRVSIAVTKHHEPKQSWKERAYISQLLFISDGSQDRSANRVGFWRQELMKRLQSGAAYWVSFHGLLSPPPNRTQDQRPRDGTPLWTGISFFDHLMRKCLRAGSHQGISSTETTSSDNSSLCQLNTQDHPVYSVITKILKIKL